MKFTPSNYTGRHIGPFYEGNKVGQVAKSITPSLHRGAIKPSYLRSNVSLLNLRPYYLIVGVHALTDFRRFSFVERSLVKRNYSASGVYSSFLSEKSYNVSWRRL